MLIGAALIVGAGLVVVITVVIRLAWLTRRLAEEVSGLTVTAGALSGQQLPRIVAALRDGKPPPEDAAGHWPAMRTSETTAAATAIAGLYRAAVASAMAEAGLRNGFRQILVSLGRRNQSLLHRQLRIIDGLEQQASNPAALADLFTLDHLTTRMRRHAESLTILSGAASGRAWSGPVPVIDVMRAATAEVEDYTRVTVITDSEEAVAAAAVTDMIHLLAELIENGTLFSPSTTRVEVRAERVANGFAIEVEDRGLGIPADQLVHINAQLANPPDFDLADADRLGLFVAGRLAARHGVHVALTPSAYRGTKAVVVLPDSVMVTPTAPGTWLEPGIGPRADAELTAGRSGRLNLRAPEMFTLAGAALPGPALTDGEYRLDTAAGAIAGAGTATADAASITATPVTAITPVTPIAPDAPVTAPSSLAEAQPPTTIHGLPRRVRPTQAPAPAPVPEVAAEGWDDRAPAGGYPRAGGTGPRHLPPDSPAPEHARTLASSLQSSWQRSRQADPAPNVAPATATDTEASPAGTGWPAWPPNGTAPDSAPDSSDSEES
jgi:signal transduction histidine kinase